MANWFRLRRRPPETPPEPPVSPVSVSEFAEGLLLSKLTAAQRADYPHGYFGVTGSRGGQYTIHTDSAVQNITGEAPFGRQEFCMGLEGSHSRWDVLLAQKIIIESDEGRFLRTAIYSYRM